MNTRSISRITWQIRRYRSFIYWFVNDLFSNFWKPLSFIIVSSFIGSSGYVAAFGFGYLYIKSLQKDEPFTVLGVSIPLGESTIALVSILLLIGILFAIAATIEYIGKRQANFISWHYADYCSKRIIRLASINTNFPDLNSGKAPRTADLQNLAFKHSRTCGIAARLFSHGLINLSSLPIGIMILLWVAPLLTLIVAVVGILVVAAYYRISVRGAKYRTRLEKTSSASRQERAKLIERAVRNSSEIDPDDEELEMLFRQGATREFGESFARQRNVIDESVLASKIATAIALVIVIGIAVSQVYSGAESWAQVLMYIAVLQFTSSKLLGTARVITSINRFYPTIHTYSSFISALKAEPPRVEFSGDLYVPRDSGEPSRLPRGKLLGLLLIDEPTRPLLQVFLSALSAGEAFDRPGGMPGYWLITSVSGPSPASFRRFFGVSKDHSSGELRQRLEDWGVNSDLANRLAGDIDQPMADSRLEIIAPEALIALQLIAAKDHGATIVIINHSTIRDASAPAMQSILTRAVEEFDYVFLAITPDSVLQLDLLDSILVADDENFLGTIEPGDLSQEHPLLAKLHEKRGSFKAVASTLIDDDDDV